jgi:S-adenosylmethionine hydrolase
MATRTSGHPVITLTTDFGTSDHFVGAMKGVILAICPNARIVDITHEIPPFEISQGAFIVAEASRWFPKKTIHVVVVDPGVGTSRRPILIEANGQYFIAPDNGILAMMYADIPHKAREINAAKYFRQPVSRTFHGRDIFAPVAAHLAAGVRPASLGKLIDDHLKLAFNKPQRTARRVWCGTILHVDRFGNLISNFHVSEFQDVRTRPFQIVVGPQTISRLALNYADSEPGEAVVIEGSSGFLEVAVNQASAAKILGCGTGAPIDLTLF